MKKVEIVCIFCIFMFSIFIYSFWEIILKKYDIHIFHPGNSFFILLTWSYILYLNRKDKTTILDLSVFIWISSFVNFIKEQFFNGTIFVLIQLTMILFLFVVYYVIKLRKDI